MRLRDLRNSVTVRLVACFVVSLIVVVLGAAGAEVLRSRNRTGAELQSSTTLAEMVISAALPALHAQQDPEAGARLLADTLDRMRHIRVEYVPQGGTSADAPPAEAARSEHAPAWFVRLFRSPTIRKVYPVMAANEPRGTIVVTGYGDDEITEIWDDLCNEIIWLVVVVLLVMSAIVWVARLALRPIEAVADGMERLSRGEFAMLDADVFELRRINARFNSLGASLQRASADNRILIDRMMGLQEAERRDIARELHDEIGSALFALRAGLLTLRHAVPGNAAACERIDDLESIIEDVQRRNRRLLERLRPMALDHLSLADALRDLVATWGNRARGIAWISEIDDTVEAGDQDAALTTYRIVQECMTNAARHSRARQVSIRLWHDQATRLLHVEVADDGIGPPADLRMGYGLLSTTERVRKLGGTLRITRNRPEGMLVSADFPCVAEQRPADAA